VFTVATVGLFSAPGTAQSLAPEEPQRTPVGVAPSIHSPFYDEIVIRPTLTTSPPGALETPEDWRSRTGSYYHSSHNSAIEKAIQFSGTPFLEQFQMPIGSFLRGRVVVGGFGSVVPMENVFWGLPGSGSLPNWSEIPMGHPGLNVPYLNGGFGLSLTLHRTGDTDRGVGSKLGRRMNWLLRRG
jgi:hypothetical protein